MPCPRIVPQHVNRSLKAKTLHLWAQLCPAKFVFCIFTPIQFLSLRGKDTISNYLGHYYVLLSSLLQQPFLLLLRHNRSSYKNGAVRWFANKLARSHYSLSVGTWFLRDNRHCALYSLGIPLNSSLAYNSFALGIRLFLWLTANQGYWTCVATLCYHWVQCFIGSPCCWQPVAERSISGRGGWNGLLLLKRNIILSPNPWSDTSTMEFALNLRGQIAEESPCCTEFL